MCSRSAFSNELATAGHTADTVETTAVVTLSMTAPEGPTVTKILLTTRATVPGIDKETFDTIAKKAKEGCPVSRVLKAAEITLDAQLV